MLHVGAMVRQDEMPAALICLPIAHHRSYPAGYSDLISKHRTKAGQLLGSLPSISPFQCGGQIAGAEQIQVANLPATFHLLPTLAPHMPPPFQSTSIIRFSLPLLPSSSWARPTKLPPLESWRPICCLSGQQTSWSLHSASDLFLTLAGF